MKKSVLVLVLAVITAGGVFAEWYDSYAPGIDGSKFFINAGIGYGLLPYNMAIPPIAASFEYGLSNIPLSLGGYFGFASYKEELTPSSTWTGTMIGIGAKASWHFNFLKNFDPYVSLVLGYLVHNQENEIIIPEIKVGNTVIQKGDTKTVKTDASAFLYGGQLGARYFFTDNIGAYIELGYSAVSVASIGLAVKF